MAQPIRDAVEASIVAIGTHTFVFGDLAEANLKIDKIDPSSFPVAVFVPPIEYTDNWSDSGSLNDTAVIRVLFLDRIPDEVDPTAEQGNEVVETQLIASRQFWQNLALQPVVREIDTVTNESLFAIYDARLWGIASQADVEFILDQPGC